MKRFMYNQLVDVENICNLKKELAALKVHLKKKDRVIVYAPRNYGKTSLVKNVIIPFFKKENKNSFVFFSDLMEVKNMESLVSRLKNSFELSFADSFPIKNMIETMKIFFKSLRPEISIDPTTNQPGISLKVFPEQKNFSIRYIMSLVKEISKEVPTLIVIDEFQDIANINEAQAHFRNAFEAMDGVPIIIMGSKRHILSEIFSVPDRPLSFWGQDLEFSPIDYSEYHHYILERFKMNNLNIKPDVSRYLQDMLWRIPEPINIICDKIMDVYQKKEITHDHIHAGIKMVLESKESRYENIIATFSSAEETVCINLAKMGELEKPQSKEFVSRCRVTNRTVGKIFEKFMNKGIIEKNNGLYRLADPILHFYLKTYR